MVIHLCMVVVVVLLKNILNPWVLEKNPFHTMSFALFSGSRTQSRTLIVFQKLVGLVRFAAMITTRIWAQIFFCGISFCWTIIRKFNMFLLSIVFSIRGSDTLIFESNLSSFYPSSTSCDEFKMLSSVQAFVFKGSKAKVTSFASFCNPYLRLGMLIT